MKGATLTIAAAPLGWAVSLLILRGIELCVEHEMRMLDQRSRNREAEGLRGSVECLNVHGHRNAIAGEQDHAA